ncbi:CRISPR-associated protein Cas4 [Paenibacillus sp. MMS18-CY102]|uniref:CRISPR-associated protein Cas4 n=1 Tax=Paenibacillus sp. MMS18-CY102 TaxID=2682849 RepID=UPI001365E2E0|nr:CRISPR-associated protein Cas4 [Paenibacillus sp. MMS18-CY102]MWC27859.1 CRISPR-associated protein Cas4 [Paenibacillus sp. MMS18-CY102]
MADRHEDDYLMLSGIQHYAFCKRQWALIHIEQYWSDNVLTFEGQRLHEKADNPCIGEKRGDLIIARSMPLVSHRLGVYGVADVVEFHRCTGEEPGAAIPARRGLWRPYPIEYKRGKPKKGAHDELQLCVQTLCLEEMFGVQIEEGALFYGEIERRTRVDIDTSLRNQAETLLGEMHDWIALGRTPVASYDKRCERCSLYEGCQPKMLGKRTAGYLENYLTLVAGSKEDRDA